MSAINGVFDSLVVGEELTAKQIAARYKVSNPYNVIYSLRSEGLPIYLNRKANGLKKYRLGTPSRRLIAAGYVAIREGLVA